MLFRSLRYVPTVTREPFPTMGRIPDLIRNGELARLVGGRGEGMPFEGMGHRYPAGDDAPPSHEAQEVGGRGGLAQGGVGQMAGILGAGGVGARADVHGELGLGRQLESVSGDHRADRLAIAHAAPCPDSQREVDAGTRLLPDAELPLGDVAPDVLARAALEGELPVVDHAGPVGGEMAHPSAFHQPGEHVGEAVLDRVGAEGQDDGRSLLPRRPDLRGRGRHVGARLG